MMKKVILTVCYAVLIILMGSVHARAMYYKKQMPRQREAYIEFRSYADYKQAIHRAVSRADKEKLKELLGLYSTLQAQGLVEQGCMDLLKDISRNLRCRDYETCRELEDQLLDICLS